MLKLILGAYVLVPAIHLVADLASNASWLF